MLICHESCDACYNCIKYGECKWSSELGCSVREESTPIVFDNPNGFAVNGRIIQSTDGRISIGVGELLGELSEENIEVLYRMATQHMKMKNGRK